MVGKLRTSDICEVSGYTRDQVQSLLKLLPPYCELRSKERIARIFRPQDLTVICVAYQLEVKCGVRRGEIGQIGTILHSTLNGPKGVSADPILVVRFHPPEVEYLASSRDPVEGNVIRLRPIFELVDAYLARPGAYVGEQATLDLDASSATYSAHTARNGRKR